VRPTSSCVQPCSVFLAEKELSAMARFNSGNAGRFLSPGPILGNARTKPVDSGDPGG
jgi:hypothetical protein